uniref:General transcription factor 3C polypeptide 5 isoform X2 n=1 Tax=Elaeis guineensis var. tenera TaxID=51953 RepID=A0A8N4F2F4_ELAGV|nr:general transcription factor 3C polypeptide 5 isoform X2 [Elaeis guineensis]
MDPPDDGPPKPSTSSVVTDGAVSGVLPAAEAFSIHYPGYPSSTERAIETLGGLPEIAKVRSSETGAMELRFRPEDPYCHPAFGNLHPSSSLLLRISKSRGGAERSSGETGGGAEGSVGEANGGGREGTPAPAESLLAEVVARVRDAYRFEGMVDYQHVLAVHAAEERRKKRPWALEGGLDLEEDVNSGIDGADVMMLVPPLFSLKDRPETIVLNPSVNLFSRNFQRGVVEHCWEMDIEPCLAIAFDIEKINWEDNIPKDMTEWEWQMAVCKLFEERPIWPRWSLHERLLEDDLDVSENQLKRLLFRAGYYFSTGPFGRFWIRKGYDPRKDPESRICCSISLKLFPPDATLDSLSMIWMTNCGFSRYQKVDFRVPSELRDANTNGKLKQTWKDLCHFQVLPSKNFVFLQLFELIDEFIQHEIRKPPDQKTCTHATGWFSMWKLRTLRLHVRIRFLSLYPKGAAECLLQSARELYERSKKEEVFSRFQKPEKEGQHFNGVPNCSAEVPCTESKEHEQEDPDGPNNCEVEDEEEEEEELDGYEYPPVVREDGYFPVDGNSYNVGESIPNDYLQELLRGFGKESQSNDALRGADLSDGEYQIYEQDSDDDNYYGDDGDGSI